MDTLVRFIREKTMLLLLDNCEHLLDACGSVVVELLNACPHLTILTTSREPLGVPGELSWRVPSLSVDDEAVELFADRARRARPEFLVGEDNNALVTQICERLDGMPLAIELSAARVRALSLRQITDSLHDRFRLLTGGARTAVRRQQTLRASVDWSHALLTEPERVLFRRLAVFAGGFDLDAAQAVGASSEVEGYQLLDQLGLLVDKSLVVADDTGDVMRYRLLETVRQYAQEKLGESGEGDQVRTRHRDYYANVISEFESQGHSADEQLLQWAQTEIDNLRAAFGWSRENSDLTTAVQLIESLRPLWLRGGRVLEALAGLDAIVAGDDNSGITPALWARAVAHQSFLAGWMGIPMDLHRGREALAIARELGDPALIVRTLIGCGMIAIYGAEEARPYFAEAIDLARSAGDQWSLCQIFSHQATASVVAGEPITGVVAAEQGRDIADALGDRFISRNCRTWMALGLMMEGDLAQANRVAGVVADEAQAAADLTMMVYSHDGHSIVLAYQGQADSAHAAAQSGWAAAEAMGGVAADTSAAVLAYAALAGGDATAARQAAEDAFRHTNPMRETFTRSTAPPAEAALACGDLVAARRWADETVAAVPGWFQMCALTVRAFVVIAQNEPEQAERDAHDALTIAARTHGYLRVADTLECLARLAADDGSHPYAGRLLGAAAAMRQRLGHARFPMYRAGYDATVTAVREALEEKDFDAVWAEGAALTTEEAIAYAQRGRGERKRPTTGWRSLTPMERDVVRLVAEGLGNKEIGTRLFVSPRTVQTHLTHVYAKLGLTSRVQLVQEAGRRT
jgi:predicted ATPase/DNA-binding CsgD family transcriptional regulator